MSKQSEVAFNIGVRESNFVADTYIKIFRMYREGYLEDWFWSVNVLREMINAHLKPDLQEELDKDEDNIKKKLSDWKSCKDRSKLYLLRRQFGSDVKKYMRKIMYCMKKLGYLPTKRDRAALGF